MTRMVILDATPLSDATRPDQAHPIIAWLEQLNGSGGLIGISELADYEVRRELLRCNKTRSIKHLDRLKRDHPYLKITTEVMVLAAELWAHARRLGAPAAGNDSLDGDMILAAQAIMARGQGYEVIVATENLKHLSLFVDARRWQDIPV